MKDLLNLALVNGRNLTLAFKQISTDLLLLLLTVIKITHSNQCVNVMTVFVAGRFVKFNFKISKALLFLPGTSTFCLV